MRGAELRSKQCGDIEPSGGIGRNGDGENLKMMNSDCGMGNAESEKKDKKIGRLRDNEMRR